MQLVNITLKGIRSFKDEMTTGIPEGITGIVGIHDINPDRSNGIGKSTLATSILYACYGDTANIKNLDDIECDQLDKKEDKFAEIVFYKAETNSNYRVRRGRKDGASYFELYEGTTPLGGTTIASRELELKRILGMDYDMFTASTFFEQNQLNKIVADDPKDRRNYIDKVLGLSVWRNAGSTLTTDYNKLKASQTEIKEAIKNLSEKNDITRYDKVLEDIVKTELTITNTTETQVKESARLSSLLESIQKQELYVTKKKSLDEKNSRKEKLDNEISSLNTVLTTLHENKVLKQAELEKIQLDVPQIQQTIKDVKVILNDITQQKSNCSIEINNLSTQELMLQKDKTLLLEQLNGFVQSKCDSCEQEITEEYKLTKTKEKNDKIQSIEVELTRIKQEKIFANDSCNKLALEEKTNNTQVLNLDSTLRTLTTKLSTIEVEIKNIDTQVEEKVKKVSLLDEDLSVLKGEITTAESELAAIPFVDLTEAEKSVQQCKQTLENINATLTSSNQSLGTLKQVKQHLEGVKKEIEDKEKILKSQELELYYYNIVDKAFKEIPTQIFEETISYTNREASSLIQRFNPNMEVELYEDKTKKNKPLEVNVTVRGRNRKFVALSEGQKTTVSLALRIGFAKVIAARSNRKIDMIILDEPFGMLDAHSQSQVQSILTDLLDYFKQILVITHIGNINNYPNLITVRMREDETSYIA